MKHSELTSATFPLIILIPVNQLNNDAGMTKFQADMIIICLYIIIFRRVSIVNIDMYVIKYTEHDIF